MIEAFLARQLARPSGLFGRWIMAALMNRSNRRMNALALQRLAPGAGDRVLEVGFGGGELLARILADPVASAAGVEPSPEMLARARRRFRAELRAGRLALHPGTADALPFAAGAFTGVCTVNTLYFWDDVPRALAECRRVLAPGGALVLCFNAARELARWPGHRHGFRLHEVAEVEDGLRAAGFAAVTTTDADDPGQGRIHCTRAEVPSA